jgi:hypothetical protein
MAGLLTVDTIQSDSSYASTLNVASKINFAAGMQIGGQDATFGGMRNRIINGAMMIDQRNAGAIVTPSTNGTYTLDRWATYFTQNSKFSVQQNAGSITPPAGFTNYIGITSTAATTVGVSDEFEVVQSIEGFNTTDLDFGKSTAKTITLSFWVRSSLTGTFGGSVYNGAVDWCYPFTYTISSANTWEQKSITISGQTSGTWSTTNAAGINVLFSLGAGSNRLATANAWINANRVGPTGQVNLVATNGATLYITGVQLEKGSAATAFENRHYGQEFALCQRYYETTSLQSFVMGFTDSGNYGGNVSLKVTKRTQPGAITGSATSNRAGGGTFTLSYGVNTGVVDSIAVQTSTAATGGTAVVASGFTVNVSAEL